MPGATANRAYPYPVDADPVDVALDIKKLADAVDADVNPIASGLARVGGRWRSAAGVLIGGGGGSNTFVWDTEDADSHGFGAPGGSVLTIPAGLGGIYAYTFLLDGTPLGSGNFGFQLSMNGGDVGWYSFTRSQTPKGTNTITLLLAPGNTLGAKLWQTSGVTHNLPGTVELWRVSI